MGKKRESISSRLRQYKRGSSRGNYNQTSGYAPVVPLSSDKNITVFRSHQGADDVWVNRNGAFLLVKEDTLTDTEWVILKAQDNEEEDTTVKTYSSATTVVGNYQYCSHKLEPLTLPDGKVIYGSGASGNLTLPRDKYAEYYKIDLGVYFDWLWADVYTQELFSTKPLPDSLKQEKPQVIMFDWSDYGLFGLPIEKYDTLVKYVVKVVKRGDKVNVGCMAGHGRTGTFLATLLLHYGMNPQESFRYLWKMYCSEAIDTVAQQNFVKQYYQQVILKRGGKRG